MSSTPTPSLIPPLPSPTLRRPLHTPLCTASPPRHVINSRRECLLLVLTAIPTMTSLGSPSASAANIPLFGLRKKLETTEKEAVELVKEGFESAEKGIDTVEKSFESAEKGIENAADSLGLSGAAQAGFVAGAELLGLLITTSIVNGILGPEPRNS